MVAQEQLVPERIPEPVVVTADKPEKEIKRPMLHALFLNHIDAIHASPGQSYDYDIDQIPKINAFADAYPLAYAAGLWYAAVTVAQHEQLLIQSSTYDLRRELVDSNIVFQTVSAVFGEDRVYKAQISTRPSKVSFAMQSFYEDIAGKNSQELEYALAAHVQARNVNSSSTS